MLKKAVEHGSNDDINCYWRTWYDSRSFGKKNRGNENQMKNRDHPDYIIVMISQNTEKSPGDRRKFAAIQALLKDNQLTLVRNTQKE